MPGTRILALTLVLVLVSGLDRAAGGEPGAEESSESVTLTEESPVPAVLKPIDAVGLVVAEGDGSLQVALNEPPPAIEGVDKNKLTGFVRIEDDEVSRRLAPYGGLRMRIVGTARIEPGMDLAAVGPKNRELEVTSIQVRSFERAPGYTTRIEGAVRHTPEISPDHLEIDVASEDQQKLVRKSLPEYVVGELQVLPPAMKKRLIAEKDRRVRLTGELWRDSGGSHGMYVDSYEVVSGALLSVSGIAQKAPGGTGGVVLALDSASAAKVGCATVPVASSPEGDKLLPFTAQPHTTVHAEVEVRGDPQGPKTLVVHKFGGASRTLRKYGGVLRLADPGSGAPFRFDLDGTEEGRPGVIAPRSVPARTDGAIDALAARLVGCRLQVAEARDEIEHTDTLVLRRGGFDVVEPGVVKIDGKVLLETPVGGAPGGGLTISIVPVSRAKASPGERVRLCDDALARELASSSGAEVELYGKADDASPGGRCIRVLAFHVEGARDESVLEESRPSGPDAVQDSRKSAKRRR